MNLGFYCSQNGRKLRVGNEQRLLEVGEGRTEIFSSVVISKFEAYFGIINNTESPSAQKKPICGWKGFNRA